MKTKKLLIGLLISTIALSGCNVLNNEENDSSSKETKILRNSPEKTYEISIYEPYSNATDIQISKTGIVEAATSSPVSAQINGKVTDIHVKVGDKVEKNSILISLGESLNTDILTVQNTASQQGLALSKEALSYTIDNANNQIEMAKRGSEMAYQSYLNAINSEKTTKDLFVEQKNNSLIELDNAKNGYKLARDGYNSIKETLTEIENQLKDLRDQINQTTDALQLKELLIAKKELETAIKTTELQVENAKTGKETAKNRVEQAQINIEVIEKTQENQLNQLNFAADNAYTQYQNSINQIKTTYIGKDLQEIQTLSQITQAESNSKITRLNLDQKEIKAPISGTITAINTKEGNFVNPGSPIITIENLDNYTVKTSLSQSEAKFIKPGQKAFVQTNNDSIIEAQISEISPALNKQTGKIDVKLSIFGAAPVLVQETVTIHFTPQMGDTRFIPLNTIFIQNGEKFVRIVGDENRLVYQKIIIGEIIGNYVEIVEGLKKSDKIVTTITTLAKEGDKITITSDEQ